MSYWARSTWRVTVLCALWIMGGTPYLAAQTLRVYSEFQRVDPFGEIVAVDRARRPGVRPREILSPAVARNAFSSYHVAVTAPAGKPFTLYMGQYPEDFFRVSVYKEIYVKLGDSWIPDGLEPVTLPYTMSLPDRSRPIAGQTTVSFWMDVWVPHDAEVGRVKLEPQIYQEDYWVTYPMEVRVVEAVVPRPPSPGTFLGAVQEPADSTARRALLEYLCERREGNSGRRRSVRLFILRNALQDVALARSLEAARGRDEIESLVRQLAGSDGAGVWCEEPVFPRDLGAEWYLRVRDALYRMVN